MTALERAFYAVMGDAPDAAAPDARAPVSPPKETIVMDIKAFEAMAKAKAGAVIRAAEQFWDKLPTDFTHPTLEALKAGVADLGAVAETAVDAAAPPQIAAIIDDVIAGIEAKAESEIAIVQARTAAATAALQAAKPAAAETAG